MIKRQVIENIGLGLNSLSTVGFRSSTQPTKCYRVPSLAKERVKPNKMAETMIMAKFLLT
ncbi:MAG: hypothetical protein BA872_00530 [Desulfobacterales bacterium C00003060]|nr:MAG: hypothetical protein BA861_12230 [Desulfobacterales bacterium S3730MH5]OEU77456.1 MAG: hypothetical protein BA872_00530 [Desulfobacterales bacterium C00003060]OEU81794.1 MAG: hypothetical protein BA865_13015 [Desulfobacterales bacterium S5133MH4]